MPFSPGVAPVGNTPSVRQMRRGSTADDSDDWGNVSIAQGRQTPGMHKAQPLLESWRWVRAQIGNRPVQSVPSGSAGQSFGQKSGNLDAGSPGGSSGRAGQISISTEGFFWGPEVNRIARFFRAANTGYSGVNSVGRASAGLLVPDGDNAYVLKRPLMRFPTRGPRSISGAMNAKARFDDTGRVPSVFVPTTPLR